MCGIAGILRFNGPPLKKDDFSFLKKMGHRLRFRGPDDEKTYFDEEVGFIFRRLSIVDLKGGAQPFSDLTNHIKLMVNGEIYNHKSLRQRYLEYPFKTSSDCEVLLPAYLEQELDFVKDLIGMFAFALWDARKKKLILGRDHFGVKPLFYTITSKGHLLFASELKALWVHPDCNKEIDFHQQLASMSPYNFYKSKAESGFKGIEYLEPGSLLVVDMQDRSFKKVKWWTLPEYGREAQIEDQRQVEEVIEGYGALLKESVKMQLMTDAGIGIALSGGIDSVSITAFASEQQPLDTFTILSLSLLQNGDAQFAHQAAKLLGVPNHQLYFPWQDNTLDYHYLKQVLFAVEAPLDAEHLYKYLMYRSINRSFPSIKTILIGQGSDEFNGGYCGSWCEFGYPPQANYDWASFVKGINRTRNFHLITALKPDLMEFSNFLRGEYLNDQKPIEPSIMFYQSHHLRTLSEYNLWHEDRNAAANRLENRVPFLDHRLVEYTARIPERLHPKLFWDKQILRRSLNRVLPEALKQRPKVPFYFGSGQRYTMRMMYNILSSNEDEFYREAIAENPYLSDVFDLQAIDDAYREIPNCPTYDQTDDLIKIASIGLLAKWVKEGVEIGQDDHIKLDWMTISDWEAEKDSLAATMRSGRAKLKETGILLIAPGVEVVVNLLETKAYVLQDGTVAYDLATEENNDFLKLLQKLDPSKPLNQLLKELDLSFSALAPFIEEGIEYGFLYQKASDLT